MSMDVSQTATTMTTRRPTTAATPILVVADRTGRRAGSRRSSWVTGWAGSAGPGEGCGSGRASPLAQAFLLRRGAAGWARARWAVASGSPSWSSRVHRERGDDREVLVPTASRDVRRRARHQGQPRRAGHVEDPRVVHQAALRHESPRAHLVGAGQARATARWMRAPAGVLSSSAKGPRPWVVESTWAATSTEPKGSPTRDPPRHQPAILMSSGTSSTPSVGRADGTDRHRAAAREDRAERCLGGPDRRSTTSGSDGRGPEPGPAVGGGAGGGAGGRVCVRRRDLPRNLFGAPPRRGEHGDGDDRRHGRAGSHPTVRCGARGPRRRVRRTVGRDHDGEGRRQPRADRGPVRCPAPGSQPRARWRDRQIRCRSARGARSRPEPGWRCAR